MFTLIVLIDQGQNLVFFYLNLVQRGGTESSLRVQPYTDANILNKLAELFRENPYGNSFIFWKLDPAMPMHIETIEGYFEKAANALLGEDVRKERNITFHSFRHFFNSTIRGSVSDDILRLQTGHLSEKMTDHYDHMTDECGELLRTAIRNKILPFVQAEGE